MRPTANSMARPMRGGIARLNKMIAAPTNRIVMVWPTPHRIPIRPACRMLRCRLTMVVTAMTWSGSVAWRMPSRNPTPITVSKFTICAIKAEPELYHPPLKYTGPLQPALSAVTFNCHFRPSFRGAFFFSKKLVPFEHILLGDHALQLAKIGTVDNRKKRPAIHVAQRRLQRIIRMQEKNLPAAQSRTECQIAFAFLDHDLERLPGDNAPSRRIQADEPNLR